MPTDAESADPDGCQAWLVVLCVAGRGSVYRGPFPSFEAAQAFCASSDSPGLMVVDATGYCSAQDAAPIVPGGIFAEELRRLAALRQRAAAWVGDELELTEADWALIKGFGAGALFVLVLIARLLWSRR